MVTPEGWHHPPDHGRQQMLRHTSHGEEPCWRQRLKPDYDTASVRTFTCDLPNLKEGFTLSCLRCYLRSVKPHSLKRKKDAGDTFRRAAALGSAQADAMAPTPGVALWCRFLHPAALPSPRVPAWSQECWTQNYTGTKEHKNELIKPKIKKTECRAKRDQKLVRIQE